MSLLRSLARLQRSGLVLASTTRAAAATTASAASQRLYCEHVPTTPFQKSLLAAGSAIGAFVDPTHDDFIATLGETTGRCALQRMHARMAASPTGAEILREQPRVSTSTVDFDQLAQLPPNTFGHAYYLYLRENGISSDTRKPVRFVDDKDLAYVAQRYREIHDFVHTLLGMSISVQAELVVKWFEMLQTGLPMTVLSSLVGPLRLPPSQQVELFTVFVPWVVRAAPKAEFLMNVYFERHMADNLDDLRARLNITPAPRSL
eukprot:m.213718 g.213718  ORF g.213718 m.213718 type:complete len:261 (-) comp15579_c0_seq3:1942-2724(-)